MSEFNERTKPTEKLTVAGIAAVIVVGVFVICVILILAKSLFPSNDESVPDGIYMGTKSSSTAAPQTESTENNDTTISIVDSAATDNTADSTADTTSTVLDSTVSSDSAASGETASLLQTAYLRSANDENSDPILSISAGETVTVVERPSDSEYVHVTYNGYDGWVWNGYLG